MRNEGNSYGSLRVSVHGGPRVVGAEIDPSAQNPSREGVVHAGTR